MDIASNETTTEAGAGHGISFGEAFRVWLRVALLSFGGPAGQIAVMHRILVEEKNWISESRFLHALNYFMLLPAPEAHHLATYIRCLRDRILGRQERPGGICRRAARWRQQHCRGRQHA